MVQDTLATQKYERVPDIHPCARDTCYGGPKNRCFEGSTGYLCGMCEDQFEEHYFISGCAHCGIWWYDLCTYGLARTTIYLLVWLSSYLNLLSVRSKASIQAIILRIWVNNMFLFSMFGTLPLKSSSFIAGWSHVYRKLLFGPYFVVLTHAKIYCIYRYFMGSVSDVRLIWYSKRLFFLIQPISDLLILSINMCCPINSVQKHYLP